MDKMATEQIAEVLEAVWTLEERESATVDKVVHSAETTVSDTLLKQLVSEGLLAVDEEDRIRLPSARHGPAPRSRTSPGRCRSAGP